MTTSRLLIAAALGAVLLSSGAASSQTIMAPEKKPAATSTPAAAAPAEKQVASVQGAKPKSAKTGSGTGRIPVYLLRGFMNVFSLGMDDLAAKIQRRGIPAVVANHTEWQAIADDIAAKMKAGWSGPVVLIGHSYGADAVMVMSEYLGKKGVTVNLVVPFDGTGSYQASANVQRVFNIYQREFAKQTRGPGFHGELTNYYVSDPDIGHMSIDKAPRLHNLVLGKLGGGGGTGTATAPKPASPAAPGATNAAPAAAPAAPSSAGQAAPHG
jgi:hypothetical protein